VLVLGAAWLHAHEAGDEAEAGCVLPVIHADPGDER
jgi:hypothetical protein